ncbi:UbiX family flavin prenyltransferase [Maridesulfovibrio hydrothermalis]|uniref:Flavin prenyltransferase UbiX n=1 Tax=Maridesulfovibrio hydrothermalis AM13 = DSM 14728 TaxID=1121451 RepID=L0RG21_9BACT|nr:UbiX family flavin prenyltransferase [Maridesulfovibrio hydrothermalis]CCO24501.1 putative aromatic acid decarboxylase [Maridesulfovibrio hydrothermalis AM13 = DSM 14728]
MDKKRIILAVTGASGTTYAVKLAQHFGKMDGIELHLILSEAALKVMELETEFTPEDLTGNADSVYPHENIAAPPASGSWDHAGMIICPCSMSSLAAIAHGFGTNLIHRAADVCLKERRKLILVTRETPLNLIHIRNMETATLAGATVMPASPGFYHTPQSIDDLSSHMAGRILEQLNIPHNLYQRWGADSQR